MHVLTMDRLSEFKTGYSERISIDVDAIEFIEVTSDNTTDTTEFFIAIASCNMRKVYGTGSPHCKFMLSVADAFAAKMGE